MTSHNAYERVVNKFNFTLLLLSWSKVRWLISIGFLKGVEKGREGKGGRGTGLCIIHRALTSRTANSFSFLSSSFPCQGKKKKKVFYPYPLFSFFFLFFLFLDRLCWARSCAEECLIHGRPILHSSDTNSYIAILKSRREGAFQKEKERGGVPEKVVLTKMG